MLVGAASGRVLPCRAIQPIPPGEEVCISYVELTGTHAERRAALQAGYHFDIAAQVHRGAPQTSHALTSSQVVSATCGRLQ